MSEDRKMKVNKKTMDAIKEYSNNHNIPIAQLKKQFEALYWGACEQFSEDDGVRAKQTLNVLKAQLNTGGSGGINLDGVILHVTFPRGVVTKKGTKDERVSSTVDIVGIFKDGKKKLIKIAAWDDAIEVVKKIPKEKVVRLTGIITKTSDKYGLQYTFSRSSSFRTLMDDEIDPAKLIKELFGKRLVEIDEVDIKPSKDRDDIKVVRGRVKDCYITSTKKGGINAVYRIFDDDNVSDEDLSGEDANAHLFTVRCDPSLGKYGSGSFCAFVGTIREQSKEYNASMWATVIAPIFKIDKKDDEFEGELRNATAKAEYIKEHGEEDVTKKGSEPKRMDDEDLEEMAEDVDLSGW